MGYGFTALNSARLTPMNHEKDGIHFVWKTNRAASVICKNVAMKKAIHIQHGRIGNSTCAGIALPRLHSVRKCAMNHFVQRLIMDGGGFRQNGGDEHLSELFKTARQSAHIVYVIHHDAGNSGKMANGNENRKRPDDCVKITQKGVWNPIKLPHE